MPEREYYDDLISNSSEPINNYVSVDKKTHTYTIKVFDEKRQQTFNKNVKCYSSGDVGCVIRNAQYGNSYKYYLSRESGSYIMANGINHYSTEDNRKAISHLVGSGEEDLYFKIKMPTIVSKSGEKISATLFYNNPNQCERHLNIEIADETKREWNEKRMDRLMNYKYKFLFKEELESSMFINDHEGQSVVVK